MAQENERRRLALELHDEVGQTITGLKLILEQASADPVSRMTQALGVTNELMRQVREISLELRPTVLDDFGLCAALDWLFKRFSNQTGVVIHHNVNPLSEQRFEKAIETAAFRVTQEALTNLARHAGVKEANVTLTIDPNSLILSISDAGKGFDLKKRPGVESSGVSGMAERVSLAGGYFNIQTTPGEGTLITVEFELASKKS
jgi:signal transduction histidine kinase